MSSEWKFRLYLFVPVAANTAQNRELLARVFVDNSSGERLEDELKMFDGITRLSTTGQTPVQAFALNTLAKPSMRDAFVTFLNSVGQARWYAVANTTDNGRTIGELLATNDPNAQPHIGIKNATFQRALTFLGLQIIRPDIEIQQRT